MNEITNQIVLDTSKIMVWYFLLIAGIIILTLWATLKHESFLPLTWGLILSGAIYYFKAQIAPLVFGVVNYDWHTNPLMFILTGVFGVMFFAYIALTIWNLHESGSVIQ